MPKAVEKKLLAVAERMMKSGQLKRKAGESAEEAKGRYTYGTMRHKLGWKPKRER